MELMIAAKGVNRPSDQDVENWNNLMIPIDGMCQMLFSALQRHAIS